jgi:hypothetical protein
MSYEKTLSWEYGQEVFLEYSLGDGALILDSWSLWLEAYEIVPTREISDAIEKYIENWLDKEYSVNGWNYESERISAILEKSWEASRER